ncbi:hypothetical protein GCM10018780_00110 [Streptomyces lanatus]|nr:hypothetical protein GCM10018780_00110 [Streptomyces lanatus]
MVCAPTHTHAVTAVPPHTPTVPARAHVVPAYIATRAREGSLPCPFLFDPANTMNTTTGPWSLAPPAP